MAIEGYLSRTATAMNEPHALTALRLISNHLVQAVDTPGDQEEVTALATAGVHAAVAFSNTLQSTTAALSGLLAAFLGVHSGAVRGVLLPHAIRSQISACATGTWPSRAPWVSTRPARSASGSLMRSPTGCGRSATRSASRRACRISASDRTPPTTSFSVPRASIHVRSDHETASFEYASNLLRAAL